MAKIWDEAENEFLRENYMNFSNQELAERFGVSKKSIQGKLRRLGLHRVNPFDESDESEYDGEERKESDTAECKNELKFKSHRLQIRIPSPPTPPYTKPRYQPRELTERRKRAIREFDNAMNLLTTDRKKAMEEFDFITQTFVSETDIVHKAKAFKQIYGDGPKKESYTPETSEDYYNYGVWYSENRLMQEALSAFEMALKLDPEYLDAAYNIACIAGHTGDIPKCIEMLDYVLGSDERMLEVAMSDKDLEHLWSNEEFIQLISDYAGDEE